MELTYSWRWSSSLEKDHINRNNIAFGLEAGLDQVELRGAEPSDTFNALKEILHGRVIIKLGAMAGNTKGLDDQPPGTPFGIERPVMGVGRSQTPTFILWKIEESANFSAPSWPPISSSGEKAR